MRCRWWCRKIRVHVERYVELLRGHKEWPESLFIQEFSMVVTIDKSINKMVFLDAVNKFVDGFPGLSE